MYPAAPRQGSHRGAMVFVGVIGIVVALLGLCGGNSTSGESGYQRDTDDFGRHDGGPSTISRMRAAVAPKEART